MKRAVTVIVATAAILSVIFVAGASAHTVRFDSAVTAQFMKAGKDPVTDPAAFSGTVTSVKPRCKRNRTVNVRQRAVDGSSTVAATDVSDLVGTWFVLQTADPAPGTYFAEAAKKVLRKSTKHRHICRKAVSGDLKVK
jgi:hypothetical protein